MPTYLYTCSQCGPFDIWRSIHDDLAGLSCSCGRPAKRVYHGIAPVVEIDMVGDTFMHPAFGEVVSSKREIANAKGRAEERTGTDLELCPDLDAYMPDSAVVDEMRDRRGRMERANGN